MNRLYADGLKTLILFWVVFCYLFSPIIVLMHYSDWSKFNRSINGLAKYLKEDMIKWGE